MVRLHYGFPENSGYHLEHLTGTFSQAYFGLIEVVGMLPGEKIDLFSLDVRQMRAAERPHKLCLHTAITAWGLGAGYLSSCFSSSLLRPLNGSVTPNG